MKWLERRRENKRWQYVGTVRGRSFVVNDHGEAVPGGERTAFWVLSKRGDGKRHARKIGRHGGSPDANHCEAQVEAWLLGGPLPPLVSDRPGPPKPGRRKTPPKARPKLELVSGSEREAA